LAATVSGALSGHPAVWAWDLGNENSNCTIPPDPAAAERWMERMTSALRAGDPGRLITIGTHMEDLENDRMIGPAEAARWCDVISMHGYPIYADWSAGPTDEHLVPFLPSHPMHPRPERRDGIGPVSAAPYGSAGILAISWAYIRMLSGAGLAHATRSAVLAANYVAARLAPSFPILYTGAHGLVAHECILDLRGLTKSTGVSVDDVAKRLIDYGFHAPTVSFPVAGTLMVEPTESEDLAELDRFCDAMIAIRAEIEEIAAGRWEVGDSPLRGAPHTAAALVSTWERAYDRETAVYPAGQTAAKYWPPVARINQAYGDRNLMCNCPPPEAFED